MQARDPFRTLGVAPDASADDVRAARRRLAKELHPDRGGDAGRMQELNAAAADALAMIDARTRPAGGSGTRPRPAPEPAPSRGRPTESPPAGGSSRPERRHAGAAGPRRVPWRVVEDVPSFVVEGSTDATFSLLAATAGSVGEVLDAEAPYVLDVALADPVRCWCRLELLPEGAATAVNLYVGGVADVVGTPIGAVPARDPFPDIDEVRDTWIAALNAAEWPLPQ